MAARPRKDGSKDLPPNLYFWSGVWVYRRPDTGQRHTLKGVKDRKVAIAAARELNAMLTPAVAMKAASAAEAVLSATPAGGSFATVMQRFVAEFLPGRKLSARTLADYTDRLERAREHFGAARLIAEIETVDVSAYLDARPANSGNKDRAVLLTLWRFALSKGLATINAVAPTLRARDTKQRTRLSIEAFRAIRAAAAPWFQIALDLALVTLQRRGDLVAIRYDDVRDGCLHVAQGKVEHHGTGRVAQRIGPQLAEIIARSRADAIASPFVLHRMPAKRRREYLAGKEHWSQIEPEMLSREFQRLRDGLHLYDTLPMPERPTFHEIRSLGAALYRDAGADPQDLLGHEDKEMTAHYLAGHWTHFDAIVPLPIEG